jgi:hypothetical protein
MLQASAALYHLSRSWVIKLTASASRVASTLQMSLFSLLASTLVIYDMRSKGTTCYVCNACLLLFLIPIHYYFVIYNESNENKIWCLDEKFCILFAYELEHFGMPKYYLHGGLKFDKLPINLLTGNSRDGLTSTIEYRNLIAPIQLRLCASSLHLRLLTCLMFFIC